MSLGATNLGNLDDKVDDHAFPADAVNEDTEPNKYENPIHPIEQSDDNNSAPGPVIRIRSHRLSNSNMRYGVDGDENSQRDSFENGVTFNHTLQIKLINKELLLSFYIFN